MPEFKKSKLADSLQNPPENNPKTDFVSCFRLVPFADKVDARFALDSVAKPTFGKAVS